MEHDQIKFSGSNLGERSGVLAFVSDLVSLTKPKIMALLLISTFCPMILATGGRIPFFLILVTLIGGALVSGSASALNCIWERDTDALMERTKNRPLPAGRLSVGTASAFAATIGMLGLLILAIYVNALAASVALFGHFFYVVIYTIALKHYTPQNIVIGGAAGSVPPVVGWAAATGEIGLTSFLLFTTVFLWTPPHFWALALVKNEDYQRAGIPMLPVVSGDKETYRQMLFYAGLLLPVTAVLALTDPNLGLFSLIAMMTLGLVFLGKVFALSRSATESEKQERAWGVFGFSLVYLALFFVCVVVDPVFF